MEAVRRLRDVGILSVFILSIFALTGLQIYQGTLKQKCVLDPAPGLNLTEEEKFEHINDTGRSRRFAIVGITAENDASNRLLKVLSIKVNILHQYA